MILEDVSDWCEYFLSHGWVRILTLVSTCKDVKPEACSRQAGHVMMVFTAYRDTDVIPTISFSSGGFGSGASHTPHSGLAEAGVCM